MIVKNFMDLGWYTVPLQGTLERKPNGSKTIPIFEKGYREKYSTFFNGKETELAGAITGKISDIIAIDCDNSVTYNMFAKLDPDYKFHFLPVGKEGGTIIYKYEEIDSFSIVNKSIALDLLSDNRFIYLPTEGNKTKLPMHEIPCEIKAMPREVKLLLEFLVTKNVITNNTNVTTNITRYNLYPLLVDYMKNAEGIEKKLFKIITPISFRGESEYIMRGSLQPKSIREGYRSKYLSQVSAILGADISVDKSMYADVMVKINNSLENPLSESELFDNIINPMSSGRAKIGNVSIWNYDQDWKKANLSGSNTLGDYYESFFDDIKGLYFVVNFTKMFVSKFKDKNKVLAYIRSISGTRITEALYDSHAKIYRTTSRPEEEFGHINENEFNLFRQSNYLAILNNPSIYSESYKEPLVTKRFLESFIPDDLIRNYVLRFLKTKFTTFGYSPVILYLLGAPGSGKDTFVSLISEIIGSIYVERPDSKVFLEKHNAFLEDKFIIHLDEYGDKLGSFSAKREVLGRLKSYTGKSEVQIRAMHCDAYNIKHYLTFILTSNNNPLPIDLNDRRFCIIGTPNALHKQEWIKEFGGLASVIDKLHKELHDFCYWLGTEFDNLDSDDYVIPPENEAKIDIMYEFATPLKKIIYTVEKKDFEKLIALGKEYNVNITEGWSACRLSVNRLSDLYSAMTDNKGNPQALKTDLKQSLGVRFYNTTYKGKTMLYMYYEELKHISPFEQAETPNLSNIIEGA